MEHVTNYTLEELQCEALETDLENFYMAIKYVLWRRERHEYER